MKPLFSDISLGVPSIEVIKIKLDSYGLEKGAGGPSILIPMAKPKAAWKGTVFDLNHLARGRLVQVAITYIFRYSFAYVDVQLMLLTI